MAETEAVLLKRFTGTGDAQALAELIRRHAGLVYGAALRILTDVDRASDVAQETFLQLTKDAASVTGSLPGWLHRVATHKAIDQMRRDACRRRRERVYATRQPDEPSEWKRISPYVDVGLRELEPELRTVLILHFLEGRTTREIALAQGTSQATVSRRIGAGVEQLRARLRRRGVLVAVGALSALLGDNAVQAAPLPLLTELGKMAMVGGVASAGTVGAGSGLQAIASGVLTAAKTKAVAVAAIAVLGAGSAVTYHELTKPASALAGVLVATSAAAGPVDNGAGVPGALQDRFTPPDNWPQAETQWPTVTAHHWTNTPAPDLANEGQGPMPWEMRYLGMMGRDGSGAGVSPPPPEYTQDQQAGQTEDLYSARTAGGSDPNRPAEPNNRGADDSDAL